MDNMEPSVVLYGREVEKGSFKNNARCFMLLMDGYTAFVKMSNICLVALVLNTMSFFYKNRIVFIKTTMLRKINIKNNEGIRFRLKFRNLSHKRVFLFCQLVRVKIGLISVRVILICLKLLYLSLYFPKSANIIIKENIFPSFADFYP